MVWIVLSLSYLAIACCLVILVVPNWLRTIVSFISFGKRLYIAGLIRIIFGVMLLMLSSCSRFWGFVVIMGLISAAAGFSFFIIALKRTKKLLQRLQNQSDIILRLFAIAGLAIWSLLVYSLLPAIPR